MVDLEPNTSRTYMGLCTVHVTPYPHSQFVFVRVCLCLICTAFVSCIAECFFLMTNVQKFRVEAASPEFTLPLDYDKHRIKLGTKGEPVPYVFHPTHTDNGILWREETWTELKVTQLSEHLQKHHQGQWFHDTQINFQ